MATGWDTVYPALLLPGCRARAYLVHDHEPEFFATSVESRWAARTYELGLYGIARARWLRDLLAERYGIAGSWFHLGVDHGVSGPGWRSDAPTPSSSTPASSPRDVPWRSGPCPD